MFDLVTQIRSWREHLAGDGEYTPSDLDELEVHLREEMTSLARKGLSEQEAFTVACMRVGDSKDLAQEFAKVNTGLVFKRRLFGWGSACWEWDSHHTPPLPYPKARPWSPHPQA